MALRPPLRRPLSAAAAAAALVMGMALAAQESTARQAFTVMARRHAFEPSRIEVQQGDVVKVSLRAEDIAHSFAIDGYRISKRAAAGETVTFEFRASTPGNFPFYCDLRDDEGCRRMHGELVVRGR
jgi:heme/copper-type cytochrome/quinol oxidase subunit 2